MQTATLAAVVMMILSPAAGVLPSVVGTAAAAESPTPEWTASDDGGGYVGSDGNYTATYAVDGTIRIYDSTGEQVANASYGGGSYSPDTPTPMGVDVSEGTIYVASTHGVAAYQPDGTQIWSDTSHAGHSLDAHNGTVYVGSLDETVYEYGSDGNTTRSFSIGSNNAIVQAVDVHDGEIHGVTVNTRAAYDLEDGSQVASQSVSYSSTPLALEVDDDAVYTGYEDGRVRATSADYSSTMWDTDLANVGTLVVEDGQLIASSDGNATVMSTTDGTQYRTVDPYPSRSDVITLATDGDGMMYLSESGGAVGAWETTSITRVTYTATVTDTSGAAIEGASVEILDGDTVVATATTDSDGTASVDVVPGSYSVGVAATGYDPVTETADLESGDASATVQLAASTYSVEGNVTDASGNPVENATVSLAQNGSTVATATTDADGSYSLSGVKTGDYTLEVSADGYASTEQSLSVMGDTTGVDVTLSQADSDGDGIADSSDPYPTHAAQGYNISVNDSKTPSSVYAELNSTSETTITVEASINGSWTQVNQTTVTPNSTPKVVEIDVSNYSDATEYRVTTHGQDASDTGVFYESDSGSGGVDDGSESLPVRVEVLVAGIVVAGAALALADW